jgi:hypothetical protein
MSLCREKAPGSFLFWKEQYSPLFPRHRRLEGGLVTSCDLLVLKLAVTATVGPNRDFTILSKTVGSGMAQYRGLASEGRAAELQTMCE